MDVVKRLPGGWITASIVAFLIAPIASPNPTRPQLCGTSQWEALIAEAAQRFDLPPGWLHAVILAESAGCDAIDGRPTTSIAGAMGLMQLMPETWAQYRKRLALGDDPHNPRDNIIAGAAYLRELYDRYGWPGASAAYHAGPKRYEEYRLAGRSLPAATLDYLARIDRSLGRMNADRSSPTMASVVADGQQSEEEFETAPRDGLFVVLRHGNRGAKREDNSENDVQQRELDGRGGEGRTK